MFPNPPGRLAQPGRCSGRRQPAGWDGEGEENPKCLPRMRDPGSDSSRAAAGARIWTQGFLLPAGWKCWGQVSV